MGESYQTYPCLLTLVDPRKELRNLIPLTHLLATFPSLMATPRHTIQRIPVCTIATTRLIITGTNSSNSIKITHTNEVEVVRLSAATSVLYTDAFLHDILFVISLLSLNVLVLVPSGC